jgi:hypothetical protein
MGTVRRLAPLSLIALLFVAIAGVAPVAAAETGRTLYVATNGRDFADDGWSVPPNAIDTPWRSIEWAVRRARAGDRIVVRGGTYQEVVGWGAVKGTSSRPIRLEAYDGERVTVKGILQFKGADYWVIRRINVVRDSSLGRKEFLVKFDGGVGWQFRDAEVSGTNGVSNVMVVGSPTYGVPRHWVIAGNCIHDNLATGDGPMRDHNLYIYPGLSSGPGLIERNIFFNAPNGGHIKLAGPDSSTGAAYVTVRYNTMVRGAAGVVLGYGTHHTTLWRNLVGSQWGGTSTYVAAYVANHLSGTSNASGYLGVWGYRKSVTATNATTRPITSRYATWVRPAFDSTTSCAGFHPGDAVSSKFGRYAP